MWGAGSLPNLGDQLILRVTFEQLRTRILHAEFKQFCPWSAQDGITRLCFDREGGWPHADSFDAVVVAGGGVFAGPPFKDPIMQLFCFGSRPSDFTPHLFAAWNAVGLQDDTLPADKPAWIEYIKQLKSRLNYCSVRSLDAAQRLHIDPHDWPVVVVPDAAYALGPLCHQKHLLVRRARIGIALGNPFHSQEFLAKLSPPEMANGCPFDSSVCLDPLEVWRSMKLPEEELQRQQNILPVVTAISKKLAQSATVEFFGFGAMYGDQDLAAKLSAQVPKSTFVRLPDPQDCDAVQDLISSYDLIIASRYHCAILAHRACRRLIAIDPHWSHHTRTSKLAQLMEAIKHSRFYWYGHSDVQQASETLSSLIDTALTVAPQDHWISYETFHKRCTEHFDRLATALLDNTSAKIRMPVGRRRSTAVVA